MLNTTEAHSFSHAGFAGRVGIATIDITPPLGVYARCWGAALHDTAQTVHRPLTMTALTLTTADSDERLVFLDADLGWWQSMEVFAEFQSRVLTEFSLEARQFILGITHTHAGPPLTKLDATLPGAALQQAWLEQICDKAVTVIEQALENSFAGILDWQTGHCQLATNRDLPDPAESADRFLCGYNPQLAADNTLLIGRITDKKQQVRAVLVNYACHPTTLAWENTALSSDFIGAMRELIQQQTGATALFLQGASGELAPRYQYTGDAAVADRHGRQLGYAALATLENMEPPGSELIFQEVRESGAPLAVWRHQPRTVASCLQAECSKVEIPLKDWPTAEEFEQQFLACPDRTLAERLRRKRDIRRSLGDGGTYPLPFWVWKLGEAILVGCSAEAYSILQQELRERFRRRSLSA